MFTLTTPVTGANQTGFSSPAYVHAVDNPPPNVAGRQYAVTALTGTQVGVDVSSSSRPFTILLNRPQQLALPPTVINGVASGPIKRNNFDILVRKGVTAVVGLPSQVAILRMRLEVPAGADINDAPNLRALCSFGQGALAQLAANLADTAITGVV
jgi:hypothetical protein